MIFLDALKTEFFAHWDGMALVWLVVAFVLAFLLRRVARRVMSFTLQMVVLFIVLGAVSLVARASGAVEVGRMLHGTGILLLGMLVIRQVGLLVFRVLVPRTGAHPPRILEELLILVAYVAWILLRLSLAGLDLGSLVASTAVLTAVLAFAMQDTLGNILSGLALQLDHSVHIGDWVQVDDVSGEVMQVQWRHTAVRTLFGEMVLIPNSQLMKARVKLIGGPSVARRLLTVFFYGDVSVRPAEVIAAVEQALGHAAFETIAANPPPVCLLFGFGEGRLTYAVRFWLTDPSAPGRSESLVRQHIHAVFQREGWSMAAPSMDLAIARRAPGDDPTDPVNRTSLLPSVRYRVLRDLELLAPMTDDELRELAERMGAVTYVEGGLIARQGEVGDELYIVARGHVDVWLEAQEGRHLLARVGVGQVVGEMSLMTGEPRRATLTAGRDVLCYVVSKDAFQAILAKRPELAEMFAQLLAERNQQLVDLRHSIPSAAAHAEKAAILARIRSLFTLS